MAYVDRKSASQRAASLASAAILQGGIGVILVYGLAATYLVEPKDKPLEATEFKLPPPPPPTEKPTETRQKTEEFITAPQPKIVTEPTGPVVVSRPIDFPPVETGGIVEPPRQPTIPPVTPRFTATSARPLGDRSRWVTTDDYPASEIRRDHAGVTGYRVSIAASGKVTGCDVVKSSGWPKLDEAACANVVKRARFEPGTDTSGAKAAGSYSGSVVWTIPR